MIDHATEFTIGHLYSRWSAIAPACTADLEVSIDLWALLQRAQSRSPSWYQLPTVLGQTYEAELAAKPASNQTKPSVRKRQGSYYTPEAIAQFMVEATLGPACRTQPTVPTILDPACGGGVFLVMAYRYLVKQYNPSRPEDVTPLLDSLFGVDMDPNAVAVTRLALGLAMIEAAAPPDLAQLSKTIRCGNALVCEESEKTDAIAPNLDRFPLKHSQFDIVLGNPPYLDSEAMTRHCPHLRAYCRTHYQTAQGNWDLFCVFVERALQLCRQGGWHSFVVPNKLASANYAAEVRSLLGQTTLLHLRNYSHVTLFQAAVYPVVYVLQNCPTAGAASLIYEVMRTLEQPTTTHRLCHTRFSSRQPWSLSPSSRQSWLTRLQTYPKLASVADVVGAASVAEAYQIQPLLREQSEPSDALQFINSGTIDRYSHAWGRKPLRYLGDRYRRPVVPRLDLAANLPKRYQQAIAPKLIIAGLTRQLECIWDQNGTLMAGKSTTLILLPRNSADDIGPTLLGLVNSELMTAYVQAVFGGNALRGGYLRIGPPQVRSLPLPCRSLDQVTPEIDSLRQLVQQRQLLGEDGSLVARRLEAAIDQVVYRLYNVSHP